MAVAEDTEDPNDMTATEQIVRLLANLEQRQALAPAAGNTPRRSPRRHYALAITHLEDALFRVQYAEKLERGLTEAPPKRGRRRAA